MTLLCSAQAEEPGMPAAAWLPGTESAGRFPGWAIPSPSLRPLEAHCVDTWHL